MKNKKNILFINNGHGEDLITSYIIKSLSDKNNNLDISVLPLVGKGERFEKLSVEVLGPRETFPSGGVIRSSIKNLLKDIKAGLLSATLKHIKELRNKKGEVDLSIVVGDVYALLLTGLFVDGQIIFIPTAKSEYIDGHYKVEKYLMKKYADKVIPRDQKTADNLIDYSINAQFYGNLMMDCFEIQKNNFNLRSDSIKIGLLPGSRDEAYENLIDFIEVIKELEKLKKAQYDFLVPVVNDFSVEKLKNKLDKTNFICNNLEDKHIKLQIISPTGLNKIFIIYNAFGDVLDQAKLFLGMAGTANEQAVGMGKPVITFPSKGVQFSYEFATNQKRLLGEGIKFIKRDFKKAAYSLIELLEDEKEYNKRSESGKKRMGKRGAINKVTDEINDFLS